MANPTQHILMIWLIGWSKINEGANKKHVINQPPLDNHQERAWRSPAGACSPVTLRHVSCLAISILTITIISSA